MEKLKGKMITILMAMREFDKDGDDLLNEKEFLGLVNSLEIANLKDESDKKFLFDSCN